MTYQNVQCCMFVLHCIKSARFVLSNCMYHYKHNALKSNTLLSVKWRSINLQMLARHEMNLVESCPNQNCWQTHIQGASPSQKCKILSSSLNFYVCSLVINLTSLVKELTTSWVFKNNCFTATTIYWENSPAPNEHDEIGQIIITHPIFNTHSKIQLNFSNIQHNSKSSLD